MTQRARSESNRIPTSPIRNRLPIGRARVGGQAVADRSVGGYEQGKDVGSFE